PPELKVRGREGKWLLRRAARGWVPDAVLDRPKMGFGVPVGEWLRGELEDLVHDTLTDGTARSRPYFDPAAVGRLIAEHESGADHGARVWALVVFELWHRTFVDGGVPASAPVGRSLR
ncbi:MAG: asparagine synthetase B, partial [Chloroflexi bacterium]|nr:asparagine synthetase B [Chloroflexota bacterium]